MTVYLNPSIRDNARYSGHKVPMGAECPQCRQDDRGMLNWQDDGTLVCQSCGTRYISPRS